MPVTSTTDAAPARWLGYWRAGPGCPWQFLAEHSDYAQCWSELRAKAPSLVGEKRVIQVGQPLEGE
jgi:hypothetical protein